MAVNGNLHKIVFGGKLALTEEWSCGVHFLQTEAGALDVTLIATAISQWMARANSSINKSAFLEWVKVNQIDPVTGHYLDQGNPRTYFYPVAVAGMGTYNIPHLSLACSTVTALARGRGSKGRFFPPTGMVASAPVSSDGRLGAVEAGVVATSNAQLLTDLNGSNFGSCVVFSKIGQITTEITGVRVGRVLDTQQRRRKNLIEDHQAAAIS